MSTKKNTSAKNATTSVQAYKHLLFLILPILFAGLMSFALPSHKTDFLVWWGLLFIIGAVAYPITASLFPHFGDKGYGLSKAVGLLIPGCVLWFLAHMSLLPYTQWAIFLLLIAFGFAGWLPKKSREHALESLRTKEGFYSILIQEMVFIVVLLIACYIKGAFPTINGEEKFMDFAFFNTLLRTETLSCPDPWMAGQSINYYYFGQYIYSFLGKASGITPGVSYTLSMVTCLALPFMMIYSLARNIYGYFRKTVGDTALYGKPLKKTKTFQYPFVSELVGFVAAFAAMVGGNAHAFYYDEKSMGNGLLSFFSSLGAKVGETTGFFYPDSTRFIGHNPDTSAADYVGQMDHTIHEFPIYSYIVGDLHAHVISLMIVILLTACLFSLYIGVVKKTAIESGSTKSTEKKNRKTRKPGAQRAAATQAITPKKEISDEDESPDEPIVSSYMMGGSSSANSTWKKYYTVFREEMCLGQVPLFLLSGALLGMALMCNYWDFVIYFIVTAMVILITSIRYSKKTMSLSGLLVFGAALGGTLFCYLTLSDQPLLHLIVQVLLTAIAMALHTHIRDAFSRVGVLLTEIFALALIAALPFNLNFQIISGAVLPTNRHTPIYQLFILWGPHIFFSLLLLVGVIFLRRYRQRTVTPLLASKPDHPLKRFFDSRLPTDVFISGLAICSFLLLLFPEFLYVADIYGEGYQRTNTMFKFCYAAFVILSQVMVYTFFRTVFYLYARCKEEKKVPKTVLRAVAITCMLGILLVPFYYPFTAIPQRSAYGANNGDFDTLDGTSYLPERDSPQLPNTGKGDLADYAAGIQWLNDNVIGLPVIVEANGDSYTDYNIVSSYTGLPTIVGWRAHEWLWRFQGIPNDEGKLVADPTKPDLWTDILNPRTDAVRTIYTSGNITEVQALLNEYQVEYIILGDLERAKFSNCNDSLLRSLGSIVFASNGFEIIKV